MKLTLFRKDIKEKLGDLIRENSSPQKVAFGLAIGVAVGISPFYGFQTILAIALSFLFGLNKPAILIGSLIGLPWFYPFFMLLHYSMGKMILGPEDSILLDRISLHTLYSVFPKLLLGYAIIGILVIPICYVIGLNAIKIYRRRNVTANSMD